MSTEEQYVEGLPDIVAIAAMINVPWETAKDYAMNVTPCPTFSDIIKARAKLRMMEAEELMRGAQ